VKPESESLLPVARLDDSGGQHDCLRNPGAIVFRRVAVSSRGACGLNGAISIVSLSTGFVTLDPQQKAGSFDRSGTPFLF
jgi:hypothetical protein